MEDGVTSMIATEEKGGKAGSFIPERKQTIYCLVIVILNSIASRQQHWTTEKNVKKITHMEHRQPT